MLRLVLPRCISVVALAGQKFRPMKRHRFCCPFFTLTLRRSILNFKHVALWFGSVIAALIGATFFLMTISYQNTLKQELTNLQNVAAALSGQLKAVQQALDHVLTEIQDDYTSQPHGAEPGKALISHRRNFMDGLVSSACVYTNDGQLITASTSCLPKQWSRRGNVPGAGLPLILDNVPEPDMVEVDENDNDEALVFRRTLLDQDGQPAGVILLRLDPHYFQEIFQSVSLGKGSAIALLSVGGRLLARVPHSAELARRSFQHTTLFTQRLQDSNYGAFEGMDAVTGSPKLYAYGTVKGVPFVVVASVDKSAALAYWREKLYSSVLLVAMMSTTLIFFAASILRHSGRQTALIGRLKESEALLTRSAGYLRTILNSIGSPVWVLDNHRNIMLFNDAFANSIALPGAALVGKSEAEVMGKSSPLSSDAVFGHLLNSGPTMQSEVQLADTHGVSRTWIRHIFRIFCPDGEKQIVNVLTDITERKKAEVRLNYIANFDSVTTLPNRMHFLRVLQAEIMAAVRQERLAVLVVSFERLQEITDHLGHEAGEHALRAIAERLQAIVSQERCLARAKTNGLALLVKVEREMNVLHCFIERVHTLLSAPLPIGGEEFYLGPVVGVSLFPQDGAHSDELLRLADIAGHRAGTEGREPVHFYSEVNHRELHSRLNTERQLRRAVDRNELNMMYQPKVDISTGRIVGFEALLRWTSLDMGEVSPAQFIPVAESTGLILEIGEWAMREACRQAAVWSGQFDRPVPVAVNLSMRQFRQKDLISMVRQNMGYGTGQAVDLELEITESVLMSRADEVEELLHQIRELGVTLSIDDFGTGYSSLAYLKRFPVQCLKIDRAFVRDLGVDRNSDAIIESIVSLAHGLGLRVVAEGVETSEQLSFLQRLGCDEYQGYLFSRPLGASEAAALLKDNWQPAADQKRSNP